MGDKNMQLNLISAALSGRSVCSFPGQPLVVEPNIQLVLQHCCKAMLYVLLPTFKSVNNLIYCKTGLMWVVKCAASLFNSFCSNVAGQVVCFFVACFFAP